MVSEFTNLRTEEGETQAAPT